MGRVVEVVASLAAPVAAELGLEIWDVEYLREAGQWFLRVYIDKAGGVGIDDCEAFSRALDPLLDEADPVPESYVFEVSSAGCGRELKRPEHFARFIENVIDVRLYQPLNGSKSLSGTLCDYVDGNITIETPSGKLSLDKSRVAQVRLHVDF